MADVRGSNNIAYVGLDRSEASATWACVILEQTQLRRRGVSEPIRKIATPPFYKEHALRSSLPLPLPPSGACVCACVRVCVCVKLCTKEFLTFLRLIPTN